MSERKPKGYWKDERNVLRELAAWRERHGGEFPTRKRLKETGNGSLANTISARGGFQRLREQEGERQVRNVVGHWKDFSRIRAAIESWRATHGKYPSGIDLNATGHASLASAIVKYHGGFQAVRERMGEPYANRPHGYWENFEHVREVIDAFRAQHGRYPSSDDLVKIPGAKSLGTMIARHHGGMNAVRIRLGAEITERGKKYWKDFEHVRPLLEEYRLAHGRLPTSRDLIAAKQNSLAMAISKYHGGFPAVAARLGLGPVTDETIATHADALATIIPQVAPPPALWSSIKKRWTQRDLDEAIAEYETSGSVERFQALADD